jgi:potassium efflux system protein
MTLRFTLTLLLALAGLLSGVAPTNGQTASTPTPAGTPASATNAPAATPPATPIPLADVVSQAQAVTTKLQNDQASLATDPITPIVTENLPLLVRQIDEQSSEDARLLQSSPSLSNLQSSQATWQSFADSLTSSEKALADRAKDIDAQIADLAQQARVWQATLLSAQAASAPGEVIQRIQATIAAVSDTAKAAQSAQTKIFSVQAQVAGQESRITSGLAAITKAENMARTQLFEQDHPPLWKADVLTVAGPGLVAQEKASLGTQLQALWTYLGEKIPAVLVHFFILVLLAIGFYWIRNTIRARTGEEAALHHAARVFDVPLATALLIALLLTGWLYPLAPRILWAVVGATALVPAIIILRRLIEPDLFFTLYAPAVAYFFDQLRYILMPAGMVSRYLFIFELLAVGIFILTALHTRHLSPANTKIRLAERILRVYFHLALFVFGFAGFANILGFVHLSILVGNGMLESSYLAVILYAAVRIVDALIISALSVRPLKNLGMVRRHYDLLYRNLSLSISWLAFGLWFVAALQVFSLRDPLWQELNALLTAQLPWFSIKFSLGRILAFPITVWASFLLSRFIRFALEEEVYPHLQLSRGIPYAASTMVHYTVLVVGFFAAVAATGTHLTQFSFLAGAFGVGLGFGLQNIMNNFVSGVILLFERPVKVGDIVQVDTNMGTVERIGIRASVIRLTNGSEYIVPNGNLISNPVTNWTLSNCERLVEIPVNVTSKVDPQHVLDLLTGVARANSRVLKNPGPQTLLVTFGGTALSFRLRAWIDSEEDWMQVTSDLSLAVNAAIAKENITMA